MTTLVIDGHPDPSSLTAALADRYLLGAGSGAHVLRLRDLDFDPHLRAGYATGQPLEADLARAREMFLDSTHVTVLTPVWWGSVPALLKGFFDRTLEIDWAFRYTERGLPQGLLAGRTGRVMITSDSPRWYLPLVGDTTAKQVKSRTLEFCGIKPVALTRHTSVRTRSEAERTRWLDEAEALGARDAAAAGGSVRGRSSQQRRPLPVRS